MLKERETIPNNTELAARVVRGAKLLDKLHPNWHKEISESNILADEFALTDACTCILGTLYDSEKAMADGEAFSIGCKAIHKAVAKHLVQPHRTKVGRLTFNTGLGYLAALHGLYVILNEITDVDGEKCDKAYLFLHKQWKKEVKARSKTVKKQKVK
jgi:hypothetical protein